MKNMKRFVSLFLAVMMVMAMSVSTFAAEATHKLTIATKAGHTYSIYQMLTGDVSGLTQTDKDGATATLANAVLGVNNSAKDVATFDKGIRGADGAYLSGAELGDAAAAFIKGNPIYVEGTGANIATEVVDGYYVVLDNWKEGAIATQQLSRYMVTVVGDTTMIPKDGTNDVDKQIVDTDKNKAIDASKKTDTAAIGDTIEYEIKGTVPDYTGYKYYYYVAEDTLSKGLTLDKDSFVVTLGGKVLNTTEDYNLRFEDTEDGGEKFVLSFKDMVAKKYTMGAAISIRYDAVVNKDAEIGKVPNTNTVILKFSNDPKNSDRHDDKPGEPGKDAKTGVTPERKTKTYVTELRLQKIDATEGKFIDALKDAEFTLKGDGLNDVTLTLGTTFARVETGKEGTGEYYLLNDGTYTNDAPITEGDHKNVDSYKETIPNYDLKENVTVSTTDAESGTMNNVTAKVNEDGQIVFTGLHIGSYTLEETKVPTGYNKAETLTFKITAEQSGSTALVGGEINWDCPDNEAIKEVLDEEDHALGVFETTITNQKGSLLPSTGGMGTTVFYLVGALLAVGACVVLISKRKMEQF